MDLFDLKNLMLVIIYQFIFSDGIFCDVVICGDEVVVVVMLGIKDVYEGYVYFFNVFIGGSLGLMFDGKFLGKENKFINKGYWFYVWIQSFFCG